MKDNIEQIQVCRDKIDALGFMYAVHKAKRMVAIDKSHAYCLLCQRWQWADKLCESALLWAMSTDPITREWDTPEEDEAWKDL